MAFLLASACLEAALSWYCWVRFSKLECEMNSCDFPCSHSLGLEGTGCPKTFNFSVVLNSTRSNPGQVAFLCPLGSWSEKEHLRSINPRYYIRNWYCYIISIVPCYNFRICLIVYASWLLCSCSEVVLKLSFKIMFKRGAVSTWPLNVTSRNRFLPMPGRCFVGLYFQASLYRRFYSPYLLAMKLPLQSLSKMGVRGPKSCSNWCFFFFFLFQWEKLNSPILLGKSASL